MKKKVVVIFYIIKCIKVVLGVRSQINLECKKEEKEINIITLFFDIINFFNREMKS